MRKVALARKKQELEEEREKQTAREEKRTLFNKILNKYNFNSSDKADWIPLFEYNNNIVLNKELLIKFITEYKDVKESIKKNLKEWYEYYMILEEYIKWRRENFVGIPIMNTQKHHQLGQMNKYIRSDLAFFSLRKIDYDKAHLPKNPKMLSQFNSFLELIEVGVLSLEKNLIEKYNQLEDSEKIIYKSREETFENNEDLIESYGHQTRTILDMNTPLEIETSY